MVGRISGIKVELWCKGSITWKRREARPGAKCRVRAAGEQRRKKKAHKQREKRSEVKVNREERSEAKGTEGKRRIARREGSGARRDQAARSDGLMKGMDGVSKCDGSFFCDMERYRQKEGIEGTVGSVWENARRHVSPQHI